MRKYTFAFGAVCTLAAAAFLGACAKDSECSGCKDKDKSSVKMEATATPSGSSSCAGKTECCKNKSASECCKNGASKNSPSGYGN